MKIDFATLAFGFSVKEGGNTPNWATALGQGKEHKINDNTEIDEILKGMTYSSVSLDKITTKIGKGGKVVRGNVDDSPIVLASVFHKVYINDILINGGKYILLITRDTSKSHAGRLRVKYGPSNTYIEKGNEIYSNQTFIQQMKNQLNLSDDACWFVSDISIRNQNELILKATIVNPNGSEEYEDNESLHNAWESLDITLIDTDKDIDKDTGKERNRIIFGAPGTGKSHKLEEDSKLFGENMERVTFHPNYSYAQFVGTYKPIQGENPTDIKYEYVPGPFMRTYVNALNNPEKKFLLLIEEINRANVAAVFGDVFQLLDRKNGVSEYPIATSEDIKKHLLEKLDCLKDQDINELSDEEKKMYIEMKIPENMYIWATMNSADQGVFPMDTAFKRRWEFEYISVNEPEQVAKIEKYVIPMCANTEQGYYVNWNDLRTRINSILIDNCKVNEDKLLGPFFISKNVLDDIKANKDEKDRILAIDKESRSDEDNNILAEICKKEISYMKAFESKVIMYLFEDVMKMRAEKIFIDYAQKKGKMIFSEICKAFEEDGEHIFGIVDIGHLGIKDTDNI